MLLACNVILLGGCRRLDRDSAERPASQTTQSNPQVQTTTFELPDCDLSPNRLDASRLSGHHQVILTWNPSSSSLGPSDQAVGYCIYRSRSADITAKDLGQCMNCTRLNRRPIIGTGCVDNRVEDGATYYYVAGATRVGAKVNLFSNKTTAAVPAHPQTKGSVGSYPLCQPDDSSPVPGSQH